MPRPTRLRSRRADAGLSEFRESFSAIRYFSDPPSISTRWRTLLSIPASSGLSLCSTARPILPRPSARRVPRWRSLWPIALRTCLILTFAILDLLRGPGNWLCGRGNRLFFRRRGRFGLLRDLAGGQHLRDRQAALRGDVLGAPQRLQSVNRRLEHV